jgi:hypothetical protein
MLPECNSPGGTFPTPSNWNGAEGSPLPAREVRRNRDEPIQPNSSLASTCTRQRRLPSSSTAFAPKRSRSRCLCSDRSNLGKPLDCVRVVPADGGFPCGRGLRGDAMRAAIKTCYVVGQHKFEIGDVNIRLVPVDQRDPIRGHADVARVGVATNGAGPTSDEPRPRGPASSNTLRRHCAEVDPRPGLRVQESVDDRQPGRCGQPAVNRCSWRSLSATRRQSAPSLAVRLPPQRRTVHIVMATSVAHSTRRATQPKRVNPPPQKYFALSETKLSV